MKYSRRALADMVLAQPPKKRSAAVKAVASYLVSNGRSAEVELLAKQIAFAAQQRGHTMATVTSAHELDNTIRAELKKMVKDLEKTDDVELQEHIDASLLGGVVIDTPRHEVDLSLSGRLNRLKGQV